MAASLDAAGVEERIGYRFNDPAWLKQALKHPSMGGKTNNQRLEFLGDGVLGAVVARLLFELFPAEAEGALARRQAALVRSETLAAIAREIGLDEALVMTESEAAAGGRQNPTNLEDACEALLGALFMDGGYAAAEAFIMPRWLPLAKSVQAPPKDAKTTLQEWAQARGLPLPIYRVVSAEGPAHAPIFTVEVCVEGQEAASASAPSKKVAEQMAAEGLLEVVGRAV